MDCDGDGGAECCLVCDEIWHFEFVDECVPPGTFPWDIVAIVDRLVDDTFAESLIANIGNAAGPVDDAVRIELEDTGAVGKHLKCSRGGRSRRPRECCPPGQRTSPDTPSRTTNARHILYG
jgi:hypothetical protein